MYEGKCMEKEDIDATTIADPFGFDSVVEVINTDTFSLFLIIRISGFSFRARSHPELLLCTC